MAHFAKISEENKVLSILKVDNLNTVNSDGIKMAISNWRSSSIYG